MCRTLLLCSWEHPPQGSKNSHAFKVQDQQPKGSPSLQLVLLCPAVGRTGKCVRAVKLFLFIRELLHAVIDRLASVIFVVRTRKWHVAVV